MKSYRYYTGLLIDNNIFKIRRNKTIANHCVATLTFENIHLMLFRRKTFCVFEVMQMFVLYDGIRNYNEIFCKYLFR